MSRRLLLAVVLCLSFLLRTSAAACPTCDLPPASVPVSDPAPQAVFEAAAPGALLPGEADWLLAAEDGRYELVNGRLADRKSAAAEAHLLSNSRAWALLGRRATERTAALRGLARDGRLPETARGEAVSLFWVRGFLVAPADRDFLRSSTLRKAAPEPGVGGFEGGIRNADDPVPGGGGRPTASASTQAAELLRSLRASLDITPGRPGEAAAMNEVLENLVNTPTGRELAVEFIASGARAVVEFGDVANSTTGVENGRRILLASGGHTSSWEKPPRVVLNRHYLDTDPDYRRIRMAGTLGHELFGHGFEEQRASSSGVSFNSVYHYRGDEAGAGLIGWLVEAEMGGRLSNGHMWNYLADPEKYHAELKTTDAYYSTTFSTAELRSPVAALEARVAAAEKDRVKTQEYAESMLGMRRAIEHFVAVHGMNQEDFSSLSDDIDSGLLWSKNHLASLDKIKAWLTAVITKWKSPEAAPLLAELAAAANSTYMRQAEDRLAARADRLRGLVGGREREPSIPPIPGKLTWSDLNGLIEKDRNDNPTHWENTK